jgi:hypothetical protein
MAGKILLLGAEATFGELDMYRRACGYDITFRKD